MHTGIQIGNGVRTVATQRVFSQGMYQQTDNPLDVVIEGDGFFQVLLPDGGIRYTRDGAFKLDADGRITTSDGFPIEPEIVVPADSLELSIASDGTVTVMRPGGENRSASVSFRSSLRQPRRFEERRPQPLYCHRSQR